ncbi:hypothetical protein [Pseudodesulfovibrio sediminis]|uniref:EF-hand domain-containing protein n=1 Tax=Pseudodesulfovibrio sediminis TaxID=2810563 RepID=A0ABN6EQF4_9BACT|nr:hypothetical protein [Pseudodesulfovibrio sediminis]BCS87326.1 hypothetical protein PSDVSF_05680 [Pseudodesulfovibrio sediminis]
MARYQVDNCVQDIMNRAGVDDNTAVEIMQSMLDQKERIGAEMEIDAIDVEMNLIAHGFGEVAHEAAMKEKQQLLRNIVLREKFDAHVEGLRTKGNLTYAQALDSVLLGTHYNMEAGRVSVSTRRADLEQRWAGKILASIEGEKPHVLKLIRKDKQFLDDVTTEMFHIDEGQLVTGNKDAQWLAQVLTDVADESRQRVQKAGADVKRLTNWVPQRHDVARIIKTGLNEWRDFMVKNDLLDMERTFGNLPPQHVNDALEQIYYKIISGRDVATMTNWQNMVVSGPANLAQQLANQHRALFFKNADKWMEYASEFGTGNVFDSVMHHLRDNAVDAASMEFMGANPQAFMERYIKHTEKKIWDDPTLTDTEKKKQAGKLPRSLDQVNSPIAMGFNLVTGRADKPHNHIGAKAGSFLRSWTSMAKLGMAVMSSVTDLSTAAARLRVQDKPLLESYAGMVKGLFEGKHDHEKKELAYLLGVGFDGMLGDIHARFMAEDQVHGKFSKAQQTFFKLSGLTDWTERNRTTFAMMSSAHMGMRTKQKWGELTERFRSTLLQHGIDERTWQAVQALEKHDVDGKGYITPEAAKTLSNEAVDAYIAPKLAEYEAFLQDQWLKKHGKRGSDIPKDEIIYKTHVDMNLHKRREALRKNARLEIQDKLGAYFIDETNYGIIVPDERTRRWQTAGLQPGTIWGEAARFMMQFKSFPIAFGQRQLMAHWRGAPGGKVDKAGLAHLIASTTVLGYVAMTLKDIVKGREPRNITDVGTWGAAFMQGGGAGIYGDFLLNKYDRFGAGPMKTIEGPVFNSLDDAARMIVNTMHGDPPSMARAFHFAKNNTPFLNLWYTRLPLDYLILYHLQEMVTPGYLRRMERRLEKENGQEMIFPPSTYIKRGGGRR